MQKIVVLLLFATFSLTVFGQNKPEWLDNDLRELQFPADHYFTGFAYSEAPAGALQNAMQNVKNEAQADLVKKIRSQISTVTQSKMLAVSNNGKYDESETFLNQSSSEATAEVAGMNIESYHDPKAKLVYAFAHVERSKLIEYYKSALSLNINHLESVVKTSQDLQNSGEKAKARRQLETAKPLFAKIRSAQELLTAIDRTSAEELQQGKTENLHNAFEQMQAQMAQNVYVYVESYEKLFNASVDIVANKVKADLAGKGCSFTDDKKIADFLLTIKVTTRVSETVGNLQFCYADAEMELIDRRKQKVVFKDEIAQKGGSNSQDKAGRKALTDVATQIAEKLKPWLE
ncbi:MAG: hypothetical protein LBC98_02160 [Prevotellaceae bacterium]|jgi:hypothetical protein|nr:hypothetical protein [Prevotellaceae bacterium]